MKQADNQNKQPEEFVKKGKIACKMCKKEGKSSNHTKHKTGLKLNSPSKGHTPKGAHGKAAVHALGRTKTTGNFKKIEAAKGKGAAIAAYQNALASHKGHKKSGKDMLGKAMKHLKH